MAYLGKLGALFEVKCGSGQDHSAMERVLFEQTLEGRAKAQVMLNRSRRWDVGYGLITPRQAADLLALDAGEYGIGPFMWVHDDALVNNLLTPAASTCDPSQVTGETIEAGGPFAGAGRSFLNSDPSQDMFFGNIPTPVIPGVKVTASAFLQGDGAAVHLRWHSVGGSLLGTVRGAPVGLASDPQRLSASGSAPADAAYCLIYGANASQGARPAITWTGKLMDWTLGDGCPQAVVSGLSRRILMTLNNDNPDYGRYWSAGFTVTEVG